MTINRTDLDNHITGHWGEGQFREDHDDGWKHDLEGSGLPDEGQAIASFRTWETDLLLSFLPEERKRAGEAESLAAYYRMRVSVIVRELRAREVQ